MTVAELSSWSPKAVSTIGLAWSTPENCAKYEWFSAQSSGGPVTMKSQDGVHAGQFVSAK